MNKRLLVLLMIVAQVVNSGESANNTEVKPVPAKVKIEGAVNSLEGVDGAGVTRNATATLANGKIITSLDRDSKDHNDPWKYRSGGTGSNSVTYQNIQKIDDGARSYTVTISGSAKVESSGGKPSGNAPKDFGWSGSVKYNIFDVQFDGVANADEIGALNKTVFFCTSQKVNEFVVIKLKKNPDNVTLPAGTVSWVGGEAGEDQLMRKVSKSKLLLNGIDIVAKVGNNEIANLKIFIFPAKPEISSIKIAITPERNDDYCKTLIMGIMESPEFGSAHPRGYLNGKEFGAGVPEREIDVYYENKKWRFIFKSISYKILWGVYDNKRTNLTPPIPVPFPLGRIMKESTPDCERRRQATKDFRPDEIGYASRYSYWNQPLAERHENYHITDWIKTATKYIYNAKTEMETTDLLVTVLLLKDAEKRDSEIAKHIAILHSIEREYVANAYLEYTDNNRHEKAAYLDGKEYYERMANSLNPD